LDVRSSDSLGDSIFGIQLLQKEANIMKCLFRFDNYKAIRQEHALATRWKILNMQIDQRMKRFKEPIHSYNSYKAKGEKNLGCLFSDGNDYEIITWIDVLHIMFRTLEKVKDFNHEEILKNLTIIQEYCIYNCNNRIDILLTKGSNILLVEFAYWFNDKETYLKKFAQVATYKSMIEQDLPKDTNVKIFVLPYKAEYSEDLTSIESDLQSRINELASTIINFFDDKKALKQIDR